MTKLLRYKFDNFKDLLGMVFLLKERNDTNLLAMIFWLIWSKRNSDKCGEKFVEIINIRVRANTLLQDFFATQNPPILPHYKINFDGACFLDRRSSWSGCNNL